MTNKEAIEILSNRLNTYYCTDEDLQALDLAIKALEERLQGECKTCKYYHPYCEQFTNEPRGDGYCVIARMTPEGMTTINCTDEFGCSDYQEKQGAKNVF